MLKDFITIKDEETVEIIEKKSRFIATIKKVENTKQAQIALDEIRKKYKDASHNTYAYCVNQKNINQKYSDDKEPQGTAGLPILEIINHNKIENVLIVVTRYFGGTLLGIGGLVRAYSKAAVEVVKKAKVVKKKACQLTTIKCDYSLLGKVKNYIIENNISIIETNFLEQVILTVLLPEDCKDRIINDIINLTSNKCEVITIKEQYMEMEI